MTTFAQLGLSDQVLKVLTEIGFEQPTDIQEKAIPRLMGEHQDFIGLAQTGTGKTAAFGLPLLEKVDSQVNHTQGLILAPTRELGKQIAEQILQFSKYLLKINVLVVYGGANISTQIKALRSNTQHIIIATPGRLIDLINRRAVKLDKLKYLVLDEADEMLNMGFKEELDTILSFTPEDKQTWLFSATMPQEIKHIVNTYMTDPFEVRINRKERVNTNIEHQFAMVRFADKTDALARFLDLDPNLMGVVFCRTKRDTQTVAEDLLKRNYKADAIHGDLPQTQRERVMRRFKNHELQVLIATDVAARGIDVSDLTHVFHYALPDGNDYYTHRSGRTARAGKKGISIAFVNGRERTRIERMERQLGISFKRVEVPKKEDIAEIRIENWCKTIVEKEDTGGMNVEIYHKAAKIFQKLTKEELVAKLVAHEFEKLNLGDAKDFSEPQRSKPPHTHNNHRSYSKPKFKGGHGKSSGYKGKKGSGGPRKSKPKKRFFNP